MELTEQMEPPERTVPPVTQDDRVCQEFLVRKGQEVLTASPVLRESVDQMDKTDYQDKA